MYDSVLKRTWNVTECLMYGRVSMICWICYLLLLPLCWLRENRSNDQNLRFKCLCEWKIIKLNMKNGPTVKSRVLHTITQTKAEIITNLQSHPLLSEAQNQTANVQRQYAQRSLCITTPCILHAHTRTKSQSYPMVYVQKARKKTIFFVALLAAASIQCSLPLTAFHIRGAWTTEPFFGNFWHRSVPSPSHSSVAFLQRSVRSFVLFWCDLFIIILYIILSHEKWQWGWETILCAKHKMLLRAFVSGTSENECEKEGIKSFIPLTTNQSKWKHTHCHIHPNKVYIHMARI